MRPVRVLLLVGCVAGCHATLATQPGDADIVPDTSSGRDATVTTTLDAPPDADVSGLVAHWTFDDDPADGALDSTGHGHLATCQGACPTLVTGKIGGGYHFDPAASQNLVVPDDPAFRGNFTVAAWFLADAGETSGSMMAKPVGTGSENTWQLELHGAGIVSLSGGTVHYLDSPALTQGVWHHAAGTWDGTTKRLYIDGVEVSSVASTSSYDNHELLLGADQNGGTTALYWAGTLDDLRIYDRALSADEIAALAQ